MDAKGEAHRKIVFDIRPVGISPSPPQQVSQAKTAAKKKAPKEAAPLEPAAKSQPKDGALNVEALQALKDLARQVGTEEATRLVRALVD